MVLTKSELLNRAGMWLTGKHKRNEGRLIASRSNVKLKTGGETKIVLCRQKAGVLALLLPALRWVVQQMYYNCPGCAGSSSIGTATARAVLGCPASVLHPPEPHLVIQLVGDHLPGRCRVVLAGVPYLPALR